jgi:hypothetical protein
MVLTLDDLTVSINHLDRNALLDDWRWLIGPTKVPLLITALGNAFVADTADGAVYIIDAGPGTLERVADSRDEFRARLRDKAFVVEHFVPKIVARMRESGQTLQSGQLYGFKIPPPQGGEYSPDNLQPADIQSHFAQLGQIHDRARSPAEHTPSDVVTIESFDI